MKRTEMEMLKHLANKLMEIYPYAPTVDTEEKRVYVFADSTGWSESIWSLFTKKEDATIWEWLKQIRMHKKVNEVIGLETKKRLFHYVVEKYNEIAIEKIKQNLEDLYEVNVEYNADKDQTIVNCIAKEYDEYIDDDDEDFDNLTKELEEE